MPNNGTPSKLTARHRYYLGEPPGYLDDGQLNAAGKLFAAEHALKFIGFMNREANVVDTAHYVSAAMQLDDEMLTTAAFLAVLSYLTDDLSLRVRFQRPEDVERERAERARAKEAS